MHFDKYNYEQVYILIYIYSQVKKRMGYYIEKLSCLNRYNTC